MHDRNVARKIVEALPVDSNVRVLEVGPGGGALTRWLLENDKIDLKAVEVDREKVDYLLSVFPELAGKLIYGDFLKLDPPFAGNFHLIGNFPYVISSQILFKVLDWREQVDAMVGMLQKEVAQRVAAAPGNKDYGILSVLLGAFFTIEYLFEVHENCFTPPPKVKSAVIRLRPKGNVYGIKDVGNFTAIVKKAFQQRRKVLRNPLKSYFCAEILKSPVFGKRAEELSVAQFVELSNKSISCQKTSEKS